MKKFILLILIIISITALIYFLPRTCPLRQQEKITGKNVIQDAQLERGLELLRIRKDKDALAIFEKILVTQPEDLDALWGKAEVARRLREYQQAEKLLNQILSNNPSHTSSLISLAYIRYKDDKLDESLKLVREALKQTDIDTRNKALAYMMLGSINGRRAKKGGFFSKLTYGTQIKNHFLKAKEIAPDLPEVHLGLGTFYLLAPAIAGGDLNKAVEELELTVKIAPEFATPHARLAQAYQKKGNAEKYNFHLNRAKELDSENEVLKEFRDGSQVNLKVSPKRDSSPNEVRTVPN